MSSGSLAGILRSIFFWIDTAIYSFIDQLYWLFSMLSEASIFTQAQIEDFASRIYVLVSIIMLFRLGFSFITYIVNPDSFTDKQKGGAALIKKIVIAIALLVSVPTIFNEAYYLQSAIIESNAIDKVLLGDTYTQNTESDKFDRSKALSTYAFFTFFKPASFMEECQNYEGISISSACIERLNSEDDTGHNPGTAYKEAIENYDLDTLKTAEIVTSVGTFVSKNENFYMADAVYLFDYNFPISTLVAVFIAWILLGFCLDLGVRAVKLSFLQIIAPIPIILSIAPQQKNNTLANWGKECLSTWASLFVRVLVISFALSLIVTINNGGIFSFVSGGTNQYSMVTVFVILGILLFAKEFPKLLEDILGIKGAGKMTFNAFKKLGSVPLVGGLATAGLTGAGGIALAAGRGVAGIGKSLALGTHSAFHGKGFGAGFKDGLNDTGTRMRNRISATGASAKEKFTSAGIKGTDKLGGSMHKSYQEGIKEYEKARKEEKEYAKSVNKGQSSVNVLNNQDTGAKPVLDKLARGENITAAERNQVQAAYSKAYKGDHQYSENEANLAMAKSKQDYLKNTVGQLERLAAANPNDQTIAQNLATAQKALSDTDKQVSGLEDMAKSMEVTHKASAEISKSIKVTKGYNNRDNVSLGSVDSSSVQQTFTNAASASASREQALQDSITNAIRPQASPNPGINSGFNSNNQ